MRNSILATRYINALLLTTDSKDKALAALNDLAEVINFISSSNELESLLYSPLVTVAQKKNLVTPLLDKYNNKTLKSFILLLIQKKRITLLSDLDQLIPNLISNYLNVLEVNVETPVNFSKEDEETIKSLLSHRFDKTINPVFTKSDKILGGFKAVVGNTIYDGTLENSFLKMKTTLKLK
jgi:F-type H+-transporting ATPase subunit delta